MFGGRVDWLVNKQVCRVVRKPGFLRIRGIQGMKEKPFNLLIPCTPSNPEKSRLQAPCSLNSINPAQKEIVSTVIVNPAA